MKRVSKYSAAVMVLLAAMLASLLFALAGCNSSSKISIEKDDMPQTVFVQGNEIDLSAGSLTVDGEKISLASEGVSVSGYDAQTLGEQTVTISYGGSSVQLKVTVVERLVAESYTNKYFTGEAFDFTKGQLKYTADNGTSSTVKFSGGEVSATYDFSSASASSPVTLAYSANGSTYTCTVNVTVVDAATVELTPPSRVSYQSDEQLDLSGGYITLKDAQNTFSRNIELSKAEVSGYAPEAVTEANISEPVTQRIRVDYAAYTEYFNVSVTYSVVKYVENKATSQGLTQLDWTSVPEITQAQGAAAMDAVAYIQEQELQDRVDAEILTAIVRTATVYGYSVWAEQTAGYNSFQVKNNQLYHLSASYEDTKADVERLASDDVLSDYGGILTVLASLFGDTTLYGSVTIGSYLQLFLTSNSAGFSYFCYALEYSVTLYEAYDANDAQSVVTVLNLLKNSGYVSEAYYSFYAAVDSWDGTFFPALYAYAYEHRTDTPAYITTLCTVYLPSELLVLKDYLDEAFYCYQTLMSYNDGYTSDFMFYFLNAVTVAEELLESDRAINIWIYHNVQFSVYGSSTVTKTLEAYIDYLEDYAAATGVYGYNDIIGAFLDDAELESMWRAYIVLVGSYFDHYYDASYTQSEEYAQAVEALMEQLITLTPSRQYAFMASLNVSYETYLAYGYNLSVLDYASSENRYYSYITLFFYEYYSDALGAEGSALLRYLLLAVENYARGSEYVGEFKTYMEAAEGAYTSLSAADKQGFDEKVGYVYTKYSALYTALTEETALRTLDDAWTKKLNDIKSAFNDMQKASAVRLSDGTTTIMLSAVIAAFERANSLIEEALASDNEDVIYALLYENRYTIDFSSAGDGSDVVEYTLEGAWSYYRSMYVYYLAYYYDIWEEYQSGGLSEFMNNAYDVIRFQMGYGASKATVLQVMEEFRQLDPFSKLIFTTFDYSGDGYYYRSLTTFFSTSYQLNSAAAANAFAQLMQVEKYYTNYTYLLSAGAEETSPATLQSARQYYLDAWAEFEELYLALVDKSVFAPNGDLYETYRYYRLAYCEATGSSIYGYEFLYGLDDGANLIAFYNKLYDECDAFRSNTTNVAAVTPATGYTFYPIATFYLSSYSVSYTQAAAVWKVFLVENPEYYWLSNQLYIFPVSFGGQSYDYLFYFNIDEAYASASVRAMYDKAIASMVSDCAEAIAGASSELERALLIHDFLIDRIDYAYDENGVAETAIWAHNLVGAAAKMGGVCETFAKTYLYLCLKFNINCIIVTGKSAGESGGDHAWNMIEIDGKWYGVDCTWDNSYAVKGGDSYTFFGTTEEFLATYYKPHTSATMGIYYLYDLPVAADERLDISDYT